MTLSTSSSAVARRMQGAKSATSGRTRDGRGLLDSLLMGESAGIPSDPVEAITHTGSVSHHGSEDILDQIREHMANVSLDNDRRRMDAQAGATITTATISSSRSSSISHPMIAAVLPATAKTVKKSPASSERKGRPEEAENNTRTPAVVQIDHVGNISKLGLEELKKKVKKYNRVIQLGQEQGGFTDKEWGKIFRRLEEYKSDLAGLQKNKDKREGN